MSDPELERILQQKMGQLASGGVKPTVVGSINLNEENFPRMIGGGKPVFVDFWAKWCGPCRYMHPVFERLAAKYAGAVVFGRLNVDENPSVATEYSVFSIPTFILFVKGEPVDRLVGAVGEGTLDALIQPYTSR